MNHRIQNFSALPFIFFSLCLLNASSAAADNFLDSPITASFVQALSQYYGIPQQQVVVIHDRGIPEEEMPVVLLVSRHAHVEPVQIVDLRSRGTSWNDILGRYHLSPTIFAVPNVPVSEGPPYGNAYGYWRNHSRPTVVYSDDDYVKFGNVYFLNHYYQRPATEIIRMHRSSNNFLVVNHAFADRHGRTVVIHEHDDGHHDEHGHDKHEEHGHDKHEGHGHDKHDDHGHGNGHGHGKGH